MAWSYLPNINSGKALTIVAPLSLSTQNSRADLVLPALDPVMYKALLIDEHIALLTRATLSDEYLTSHAQFFLFISSI
jgi:hypothetical protein